MHGTYQFEKYTTYVKIDERESSASSKTILSRIDRRIRELKDERDIVRHISAKLSLFLRTNSINPVNEDVLDYRNHFIKEEKEKRNAGDDHEKVIQGLENMLKEYQDEINLFKSNGDGPNTRTIEDIFVFKWQLFELPIARQYIREQVETLTFNKVNIVEQREEYVHLPANAKNSTTMQELKKVVR